MMGTTIIMTIVRMILTMTMVMMVMMIKDSDNYMIIMTMVMRMGAIFGNAIDTPTIWCWWLRWTWRDL